MSFMKRNKETNMLQLILLFQSIKMAVQSQVFQTLMVQMLFSKFPGSYFRMVGKSLIIIVLSRKQANPFKHDILKVGKPL